MDEIEPENNDLKLVGSSNIQSLIKDYTNKLPNINNWPFYQGEHIPEKMLKNALSNIAIGTHESEILFCVDLTVWEPGKKGFVFTEDKLYWNVGKNKGVIEYTLDLEKRDKIK